MIVKNAVLSWAFISRADDNGNFRVTFEVTPEQAKEIDDALAAVCKENSKDFDKVDWRGSKKIDENGKITYSAKCAKSFKNKQGEEVERELPVYDRKAQQMDPVPNINNGAIGNVDVAIYYAKYKQKCGAMLGLRGIQLVEYTEYEGHNNFKSLDDDANDLTGLSEGDEIPFNKSSNKSDSLFA